MALTVKNLPATQETRVQSLGQEDPLEKAMATHSSMLAWRMSWTEEPGRLHGVTRVEQNLVTQFFFWSIYGISQDPSMCVHASLRQNGFNRKGLQAERCLTSPLTAQVSVCAHVVKEVC